MLLFVALLVLIILLKILVLVLLVLVVILLVLARDIHLCQEYMIKLSRNERKIISNVLNPAEAFFLFDIFGPFCSVLLLFDYYSAVPVYQLETHVEILPYLNELLLLCFRAELKKKLAEQRAIKEKNLQLMEKFQRLTDENVIYQLYLHYINTYASSYPL